MTDALIERLVQESADGCCGNGVWRGHFCAYHQGYEDGLDKMAAVLEVAASDSHGEDPALD